MKVILIGTFFILFFIMFILFQMLQKNKTKEAFLEAYQGSDTNFENCKKSGYPHRWCLRLQEPYSIPNPESLTDCT